MIRKIKGTMDILPDKTPLFRHIESVMRGEAARYGFGEIRTPMFENTELFERGVGDTTDVVQKEMYTFADRDENRRISLRPEGTAPVVRALLEHGCQSDPMPLKYYYIISCFRHEAPQAGRSREFFQFGTELFGSESAIADATVISLASSVFDRLGLRNIKLHLNSIGCAKCRPAYRDALKAHFGEHSGELCDTCHTRLEKNPLRLLDCKSPICSAIARRAPKTLDYLCDDCAAHFKTLTSALDAMGISYELDPAIVRGLDYYTRTVFEFIAEGIGAQSTVCGGGRYDGLVESLGGAPMSGIGFGMGLTRVILAMEQQGIADIDGEKPRIYLASLGERAQIKAAEITERLRREGIFAECDLVGRSLKAQMKYANKLGADYVLMLGDNEIDSGRAILRDMKNAAQSEVELLGFTLPENA
ncbi:MAG: histidine--tRNA ligase [Clostridia bacterium]|nr:histidine--tRNA ligase [Clostridia bacterium]